MVTSVKIVTSVKMVTSVKRAKFDYFTLLTFKKLSRKS